MPMRMPEPWRETLQGFLLFKMPRMKKYAHRRGGHYQQKEKYLLQDPIFQVKLSRLKSFCILQWGGKMDCLSKLWRSKQIEREKGCGAGGKNPVGKRISLNPRKPAFFSVDRGKSSSFCPQEMDRSGEKRCSISPSLSLSPPTMAKKSRPESPNQDLKPRRIERNKKVFCILSKLLLLPFFLVHQGKRKFNKRASNQANLSRPPEALVMTSNNNMYAVLVGEGIIIPAEFIFLNT